jgi:hypothetical protein
MLFVPLLVTHVIVAVLGLGPIASVAVVAGSARRGHRSTSEPAAWLSTLLRYSAVSLGAMLLTGVLMDLAMSGAFNRRWWFRAAALLVVATGALHAQARRAVRRGLAEGDLGDAALRRVEWIAYAMCALIAVATALMEVKPF